MTAYGHNGAGWRHPAAVLTLLVFAFGLLVTGRLHLPLLEPEESLYAVVARDTMTGDEFVVPLLRGEPYLDKPPLLYWLVMVSYKVFGVHIWSARLVPAVAAWLTVLVVFGWGRACGGWAVGFVAAAVLTLTGDYCYRGPMVSPNGLLGLLTTAGLACGHLAIRSGRVRTGWWAASAVATGLAVMTKGPVGVVLVAVPLFALPWVCRGFARPGLRGWLLFLAVVVVTAGPWFVAVSARQPEFVEYFFWKHNVRRFTDPFDHAKPVYFYLPQLTLGGLPWTLLPVAAVGFTVANCSRNWLSSDGSFALLSATLGFVFFSLSGSKRSVYLVPLWPVVAFGVGTLLAPVFNGSVATRLRVSRRGWLLVGGAVAGVLLTGLLAWLPDYHRQFGFSDAATRLRELPPDAAVCAYPHPWNSLDFDRGGDRLPTFTEGQRAELFDWVRASGGAVVVVKTGAAHDDLSRSLPDDLQAVEDRPCGTANVLTLKRLVGGTPRP